MVESDRSKQLVLEAWTEIKASYKKALEDSKLSAQEVFRLLVSVATAASKLVFEVAKEPNSETKKILVLDLVSDFYQEVLEPLDIPGVPNFIENTVVDPMVGKALPLIVGAVYDAVTKLIQQSLPGNDFIILATQKASVVNLE